MVVRVCLYVLDDDDESVAFIDVFCIGIGIIIGWRVTMLHNIHDQRTHMQIRFVYKLIDFSLCFDHICIRFAFLIEED